MEPDNDSCTAAVDAAATPDQWAPEACHHGRGGLPSAAGLHVRADAVYYFMVSSFRGSDGGELQLLVRPPADLTQTMTRVRVRMTTASGWAFHRGSARANVSGRVYDGGLRVIAHPRRARVHLH